MAEGSLKAFEMPAWILAKEAELEAHRVTCKVDPCTDCGRYRCPSCAAKVEAQGHCGPCEATRHRERLLAGVDLARDFFDCEMSGPRARGVLSPTTLVRAAASLQTKRIVLTGLHGSGKTTLLAAMMIARTTAAHARWRGFWVSAHDLAKARSMASLGSEPETVRRALQADLLCVDELGGESDRYGSALSEVIYERHAQGRQTWVTTGVSPQAIAQRYGGGIARRVFEDVPEAPEQHARFDLVRGR